MSINMNVAMPDDVTITYWVPITGSLDLSSGVVWYLYRGWVNKTSYDAGHPPVQGAEMSKSIQGDKTSSLFIQVSGYIDAQAIQQTEFAGGTVA